MIRLLLPTPFHMGFPGNGRSAFLQTAVSPQAGPAVHCGLMIRIFENLIKMILRISRVPDFFDFEFRMPRTFSGQFAGHHWSFLEPAKYRTAAVLHAIDCTVQEMIQLFMFCGHYQRNCPAVESHETLLFSWNNASSGLHNKTVFGIDHNMDRTYKSPHLHPAVQVQYP